MTPNRPYLIRAFYDWIVDNELTPHLVIDAEKPNVFVPKEHVEEGRIVLNVAPIAVNELVLGNDLVEFDARFEGEVRHISAPCSAVVAIYASENGRGMVFTDEENELEEEGGEGGAKSKTVAPLPKGKKPHLKIVK